MKNNSIIKHLEISKTPRIPNMPNTNNIPTIPNILLSKLRQPAIFTINQDLVINIYNELVKWADKIDRKCLGLHAKQIGYNYPVFITIDSKTKKITGYYNTIYYPLDDQHVRRLESCLSFNNLYMVKRYTNIQVEGFQIIPQTEINNDNNNPRIVYVSHFSDNEDAFNQQEIGYVLQHEIDHSIGKLICDIGKPL